MIDVKAGRMKFNGVEIHPDMSLEDFKKYGSENVHIIDQGQGRGIVTLQKDVVSNGIRAEVTVWIHPAINRFWVTILPGLKGLEGLDLLGAGKQWIFGQIPEQLFEECTDSSLVGRFSWGSIVAQYVPNRDYGRAGGELQILYEARPCV